MCHAPCLSPMFLCPASSSQVIMMARAISAMPAREIIRQGRWQFWEYKAFLAAGIRTIIERDRHHYHNCIVSVHFSCTTKIPQRERGFWNMNCFCLYCFCLFFQFTDNKIPHKIKKISNYIFFIINFGLLLTTTGNRKMISDTDY